MCSSSGGGSPAPTEPEPTEPVPIPEGLFLRPADDADAKVYSNGKGLLPAGINTETLLGTFGHDELQIDDDPSDDISIGYSYSLAEDLSPPEDNPDLEYSNNLFDINNNQLSFTGTDSMPPYTLKIDITQSVAINLPDGSRYDVDATNDDTDADTREFVFSGGAFSDTKEVAEVLAMDATPAVAASKTYTGGTNDVLTITAKTAGVAGNDLKVNFADDDSNLNITFSYNESSKTLIVNFNGSNDFTSAFQTAFNGSTAYASTAEETLIKSLFTIVATGDDAGRLFASQNITGNLEGGMDAIEAVDGDTAHRTIDVAAGKIYLADAVSGTGKIITFDAVDDLRIDATSFVIVTDNGDGTGVVSTVTTLPTNTDFYVLGEVEVDPVAAVAASLKKGTTNNATFTADEAGTAGNSLRISFSTTADTSGTDVVLSYASNILIITYDGASALSHLDTAFTASSDTDITSRFDLAIGGTNSTLLSTIFTLGTESLAGGALSTTTGAAPTSNTTGETHNAGNVYSWETLERLGTEDYIINLAP